MFCHSRFSMSRLPSARWHPKMWHPRGLRDALDRDSKPRMLAPRSIAIFVLCSVTSLAPMLARAQQGVRSFVRSVVDNELAADKNDHSRWMFRNANKVPNKSTVTLVIQTPEGDLSKTIEMNGHPLTPQ